MSKQGGDRRLFSLSPRGYNLASGFALLCPVTTRRKGYPFEIEVPSGSSVSGVVLSDQLKSLDWKARKVEYAGKLSEPTLLAIWQNLKLLLTVSN